MTRSQSRGCKRSQISVHQAYHDRISYVTERLLFFGGKRRILISRIQNLGAQGEFRHTDIRRRPPLDGSLRARAPWENRPVGLPPRKTPGMGGARRRLFPFPGGVTLESPRASQATAQGVEPLGPTPLRPPPPFDVVAEGSLLHK